ncbi:MAG: ABC transporter permease [Capsulimonadaceae bacterium]
MKPVGRDRRIRALSLGSTAVRIGLARLAAALGLSMAAAWFILKLSGRDAAAAMTALCAGSTGIVPGPPIQWDGFTGAGIAAEATPLLFCGLAVAICLRAGLFNIGATGQMILGAFVAACAGLRLPPGTPGIVGAAVTLVAGAGAGGLIGALCGWLKAYRNVHEVISTIMLNYIAVDLTQYCVTAYLADPGTLAMQTRKLPSSFWLAPWVPGTYLTGGAVLALLALCAYALVVAATPFGFRVRAIGAGHDAARAAGIPIRKVTVQVMALGGLLAGTAGALQVLGVYHRFLPNSAGGYGFQGIGVALLANVSASGMLLSSLLFGGLNHGATIMQLQTGAPSSLISIVQGVIILASAARRFGLFRRRWASEPESVEGAK